jgi:hypothetical protein
MCGIVGLFARDGGRAPSHISAWTGARVLGMARNSLVGQSRATIGFRPQSLRTEWEQMTVTWPTRSLVPARSHGDSVGRAR